MTKLQLYKYLGTQLGIRSVKFLKTAFNVKSTPITRQQLQDIVKARTGITAYCLDRKYYVTDWEVWKGLIEHDWTDKKQYLHDKYDCDNFSNSFCARMSEIYDLNSAGKLRCDVYRADNGEKIAGHLAVLIVTTDGKVFLYESQRDTYLEIKTPDQKLILGSWEYRLNFGRFG